MGGAVAFALFGPVHGDERRERPCRLVVVDVGRREILSLAATLGTSAAIAQNEAWERVAYALSQPKATDEGAIREIEARAAGFHQLEEWVPATTLYKGLAAHLREVGTLLNGTPTDPRDELRSRLVTAAGESAVLAGWLASDMGDTATARGMQGRAQLSETEPRR